MAIGTRTFLSILACMSLMLGGCGGSAGPSTTIAQTPQPVGSSPVDGTATPELHSNQPTDGDADSNNTTNSEFVPDYSALVAAVELEMEGTAYEGAALEDPEVFIATAELFCDLLSEGLTHEQLLGEYLDRLSDGGTEEIAEDDGLMAGVLLGVSMEIVCPEERVDAP